MKRIVYLLILTLVAALVDLVVITNGFVFNYYHQLGWVVVWAICYFVWDDFLLSLASVIVVAVGEDFLFFAIKAAFEGTPLYPLYSHQWVPEMWGEWASFLVWDWLGFPSMYFLALPIAIAVIIIAQRRSKKIVISNIIPPVPKIPST